MSMNVSISWDDGARWRYSEISRDWVSCGEVDRILTQDEWDRAASWWPDVATLTTPPKPHKPLCVDDLETPPEDIVVDTVDAQRLTDLVLDRHPDLVRPGGNGYLSYNKSPSPGVGLAFNINRLVVWDVASNKWLDIPSGMVLEEAYSWSMAKAFPYTETSLRHCTDYQLDQEVARRAVAKVQKARTALEALSDEHAKALLASMGYLSRGG